MQNRNLKWIGLALVPAFFVASLSNLIANHASGRLDDAAKLELRDDAALSSETANFKPARPPRLLLPVAMDRAESIRALFENDEARALDDLQERIGVYRPWAKR